MLEAGIAAFVQSGERKMVLIYLLKLHISKLA